ncbi:Mannan endo-1,4-beta-mannosidase 2 [Acorus calamus]|uniref:mannan endo-1,4-beta-mannosidase n=1 Tax=Acorus calamus TaxID=4465 RepID=A0AAV9EBL8_ACOCL|nr:Mannan endo-1,4-beta-mannosidase 2 [Acorus calamus]
MVTLVLSLVAVFGEGDPFVTTRNTQFVLRGSPFLFNGFNSYWMMNLASDPSQRYKVSDVLREASAMGLTVCRTWAFSDGGNHALQISPGVYDERIFQALDLVISEAKKYNIRLILSLVNNFKEFGGRPQYVQWAKNAGASVKADDDFYTNPTVMDYYKNHVKVKVLTRYNTITRTVYKDDATIMAWELINEPRCVVDYSGKTIHAWAQEMATYTKSVDNKHLLEIGMEGFYGDSTPEKRQFNPGYQVGTDFISSNLIKEVDFATIHAYPDVWLSGKNDQTQTAFVQQWMSSHFTDASRVLKKPLVFTEFGKSKKDPGYNANVRDAYMNTIYREIYNYARTGGTVGGGLVWQVMAKGMESYHDGYEIVLTQDTSTSGLISRQSRVMTSLGQMLGKPRQEEASSVDGAVEEKNVSSDVVVVARRGHHRRLRGHQMYGV